MHTITHRQLNEQPQLAIDVKSFYGRDIRRANCTAAEPTFQSRHFFGVATLKTYIFGALLNSLHSGFAFVLANLILYGKIRLLYVLSIDCGGAFKVRAFDQAHFKYFLLV